MQISLVYKHKLAPASSSFAPTKRGFGCGRYTGGVRGKASTNRIGTCKAGSCHVYKGKVEGCFDFDDPYVVEEAV